MADPTEDEIEVDEEAERDDDPSSRHIKFEIATYPSDLTLSVLHEMWNQKDIEIPAFQRNFVWTIKQSSLLIESFLLGLPVPQVFFYIDENHKNLVIDGQQRILSIFFFFEGYFGFENLGKRRVFRLTGLSEGSPYSGKKFEDLDLSDQRRLKSAVLRVVNIRQLAPANQSTSMYHIFERLNTGGTPLRPQEIRNCVFHGPIVDILNNLNEINDWRGVLGKKKIDKHQRDVEMILRVFAMCERGAEYEKPMKEFLNQAMRANVSGRTQKFKAFSTHFPIVVEMVRHKLPEKPFHVRGPFNLAAMDSVLSVLILGVKRMPNDLSERFARLLKDEKYRDAIFFNTSDASVVKERLRLSRHYLME